MEHVEIIINNIPKNKIDDFFHEYIWFEGQNIISSHFFDAKKSIDIDFVHIKSFQHYFESPGSCYMNLVKIDMGIELRNVIIHISCNEVDGDITLNFKEDEFASNDHNEMKHNVSTILSTLLKIAKKSICKEIIWGYEPADNNDMRILKIEKEQIIMYNEDVFTESLAKYIFDMVNLQPNKS